MALFEALNATGHTIVVVTHEPDIARHARRIITFRDGKIAKEIKVPLTPTIRTHEQMRGCRKTVDGRYLVSAKGDRAVLELSADGKRYEMAHSDTPTQLSAPGLPFSLVFRVEPGKEDISLNVAAAYEAASLRRVPPPAFPPLHK